MLKINYIIQSPSGAIEQLGTITKETTRDLLRRVKYLQKTYLSLIKFY